MMFIPVKQRQRDIAAEYREFSSATNDIHYLSGRGDRKDRTECMNNLICERMEFSANDRVLDIGCGDASLLTTIAPRVNDAVGTVLTEEERDRLQRANDRCEISFYTASFDDLSVIPGLFDRIVVNSALHIVSSPQAGRRAMKNIAAKLVDGGYLWIGDVPSKSHTRREFTSRLEAITYVTRKYGKKFALKFARHMWRHWDRASPIVEKPAFLWILRPEEMVSGANDCGLVIAGLWGCFELTGDDFYKLQNRVSYLFRKVSSAKEPS